MTLILTPTVCGALIRGFEHEHAHFTAEIGGVVAAADAYDDSIIPRADYIIEQSMREMADCLARARETERQILEDMRTIVLRDMHDATHNCRCEMIPVHANRKTWRDWIQWLKRKATGE